MSLPLLCLKIFFARITDVTLGTIKTIFSVRGKTLIAGIISFVEVFIWFVIVKEALNTDIKSIWIVIFYAGGYSMGTILGTYISKTFINNLISVEVITSKGTPQNIKKIRNKGYGVSVVETKDNYKESDHNTILFITLNSRYLKELKEIVYSIDKNSFMVINESKVVHNGYIK